MSTQASTVQILGAEKALFRALKQKHDTPKYGLIYHASLVGQAQPKHKGKISRLLAAKCALSIRVDALGDANEATIGYDARLKVEERLRVLDGRPPAADGAAASSSNGPRQPPVSMAASADATKGYSTAGDVAGLKRKADTNGDGEKPKLTKEEKAAKKAKKEAKRAAEDGDGEKAKKKKKKDKD